VPAEKNTKDGSIDFDRLRNYQKKYKNNITHNNNIFHKINLQFRQKEFIVFILPRQWQIDYWLKTV